MNAPSTELRVLVGSGGVATEARRSKYRDLVARHFSDCETIHFVPFASHDHSGYKDRMQEFIGQKGPTLIGIENLENSEEWSKVEGIYVGGGNSFLLVDELHNRNMVEKIRNCVTNGIPFFGVSAGANVASPTMMTTNDMPIALPKSFQSMGIVPFQINPHYHPGNIVFRDGDEFVDHYGESREQRIREYHRVSETPVLGMWEGSYVDWNGSIGKLTGRATVFRRGEPPSDIGDGEKFNHKLETCNW